MQKEIKGDLWWNLIGFWLVKDNPGFQLLYFLKKYFVKPLDGNLAQVAFMKFLKFLFLKL